MTKLNWIQAGLCFIGLLFIGIGIFTGESGAVLTKATYICLECIGIG